MYDCVRSMGDSRCEAEGIRELDLQCYLFLLVALASPTFQAVSTASLSIHQGGVQDAAGPCPGKS